MENISDAVNKKINNCKRNDKNVFAREGNLTNQHVYNLLIRQECKCYICKEALMLSKWKKYCCYQFSIDRIDNTKPHDEGNVLITCYYCNCKNDTRFNQYDKICSSGCHTVPKQLRNREHVLQQEIDDILNNKKTGIVFQDVEGKYSLEDIEDVLIKIGHERDYNYNSTVRIIDENGDVVTTLFYPEDDYDSDGFERGFH